MWLRISNFIIDNRYTLLIVLALITAFMGWKATEVKMSYNVVQITPEDDPDFQTYMAFREQFGVDGNNIVIGFKSRHLFTQELFADLYDLTEAIDSRPEIQRVVSLANLQRLEKVPGRREFRMTRVVQERPNTQVEVDSLRKELMSLPFYEGMIYNDSTRATLILVQFDQETLASKQRWDAIQAITAYADEFAENNNLQVHYSGMPFIRTQISKKLANELKIFSSVSVLVVALILLIFFRSFSAMVFPLIVIIIMLIWVLGSISLLGYKLNILSGLLPPLIVIISVPNFIYFLNKYHNEYQKHKDKLTAIHRMVEKIGIITFLTNFTTAIGFGVLAFTSSPVLREFGTVASLNIIGTFLVSLITIPVVYSLMPEPSARQTKYLQNKWLQHVLDKVDYWVHHRRKMVYGVTLLVVAVAGYGLTQLKTVGYILDDIPKNDRLYTDMVFFEEHFSGVMPLEIVVDTRDKRGLVRLENLEKIEQLGDTLASYDEITRPLSVTEMVKFSRQAFYNGSEERYGLPSNRERSFLLPYLRGVQSDNPMTASMVDTNMQVARISATMEDVGSIRMREIKDSLEMQIAQIFPPDAFDVDITGLSVLYVKNTKYLVESLISSLILAFILVSIILGLLFRQARMILISVVPNFIPLLVSAGIMGLAGIPLKPSTVLVFSIAFGISVDDALHFLAKYRQELKYHNWKVSKTVSVALRETGVSMVYTSLVLFFGFSIFDASSFGGTAMLGLLTSITLLVAMCTNLIILPSLLLSFDKRERVRKLNKVKK